MVDEKLFRDIVLVFDGFCNTSDMLISCNLVLEVFLRRIIMAKTHLIRKVDKSVYIKTACGLGNANKLTTTKLYDVTCRNCLRCMTLKEVQRYLGGSNG